MNYIIFDLEATREKDDRNFQREIIEIGAVKIDGDSEIVSEFTSFIRPVITPKLTNFCMELTSITQEQVDAADTFKTVLNRFLEWIGDESYYLCSWGFYDKTQFKKDCNLHGVDTKWLNNHISLKHQHGVKIMGIEKGVGMQKALSKAGLKLVGTHHRGIDDARSIAQLFTFYRDMWEFH